MIPTQNRPHALLISGQPEAVLPALKAEIKGLLCEANASESASVACGECASCHLFESEAGHPDVMILMPEGKMNLIKIDSIRDIIGFLSQTSIRGGLRVVLLVEADALNMASQNALLKSLEEPGDHALLILLTDKPHLLLPTIRSRCQLVKQKEASGAVCGEELAQKLLFPKGVIASLNALKEVPLIDIVDTQMQILYDAFILKTNFSHAQLHFPRLQAQIQENTKKESVQTLCQRYDALIEKKQLLTKQVALNTELMLSQILLSI